MRTKIASAVQAVGAVVLSAGVGLVHTAAGVITLGVCAVVFGVALERD